MYGPAIKPDAPLAFSCCYKQYSVVLDSCFDLGVEHLLQEEPQHSAFRSSCWFVTLSMQKQTKVDDDFL